MGRRGGNTDFSYNGKSRRKSYADGKRKTPVGVFQQKEIKYITPEQEEASEKRKKEFELYKIMSRVIQTFYLMGFVDTEDIIKVLLQKDVMPTEWLEKDQKGNIKVKDRKKWWINDNKIPEEDKIGVERIKAFIRENLDKGRELDKILEAIQTEGLLLGAHVKNGLFEKNKNTFIKKLADQTIIEIEEKGTGHDDDDDAR